VGSRPLVLLALAVVLGATACGGEAELFDRDATMSCLRGAGVRVDREKIGFIASTAQAGAFRARFFGNTVTVSFGASTDDAEQVERAYRRFDGERLGARLPHVLKRERNAVMRWGIAPSLEDEGAVRTCLTS
jgi:hypothetical protein